MATADPAPIVDLRLLSQSEINNLALSSPNAFSLDTLSDVVPKIDRSVFNESAGSRKQTYSRLPLFQSQSQSQSQPQIPQPQPQSQPPNPALPRRRGRPRLHPLPAPSPSPAPAPGPAEDSAPPDFGREENLHIVSILKKLLEDREKCSSNNNKIKNNNRSIVVFSEVDRDREVRNGKGVAVDLAALAGTEDLFGEEIRRRTDGLRTEDQLLGYMTGLDGQWGSRRKKRKVVDAAMFGDGLPKGWKVLLGLKRKEGIVYLNCRRYVSPSGKQFMSCKEVSSYILSLNGQQDAGQPFSGQHDNHASSMDRLTPGSVTGHIPQDDSRKEEMANFPFVAPISYVSTEYEKQVQLFRVRKQAMSEHDNSLECHECNITFGDKDAHLQHLSAFHQSAKRRKLGKSLTDGVIVKDGKYECQFCNKTFTERHRYNGHIGAHIRYEGLSVDASPHNITTRTNDNSSSLAIVPVVSSELNISANKSEETYATKSFNDQNHIDPPLCTWEADMDEIKDGPKAEAPEITEAVSGNCKKEIECTAGAPEITEAVSSENTIQHIPKEGTHEIAKAVSSVNKIEEDPKEGTPKFTEAFSSNNKIEHDPKEGAPEITEAVSSRKFVDSQSEDCKIICEESKELIKDQNVTDITSNACTDVISPCGPDENNATHTCSPIINQESTTSESVHEKINNCEIAGDKSGVIEDINAQDGKPNMCLDSIAPTLVGDATTIKTNSEAGMSSSKSRIINGSIDDHMVVDYESENYADTNNAMSIEIAEEIGHFSSKGEFVGGQIDECEITGYKSEVVDAKDAMSIEDNACMNTLSPSLINGDNTSYENPNTIDPSSFTVISAFENCNGDEKVYEEHHLLSLSGNGPSYGVETYASDIFTSKGLERGELDTSIHDKSDAGSCQALTNKDTGIASTMHNELNTSYIFTNIASEPTSGIETNADCMFPGDLNKSLLEGIEAVGNELQNYFHSSNACDEGAAGIIMSNGDEGQGLQVNVADHSSSWVQSSNNFPILDLIPDQCQDELRGAVPRNEQANLSGFGELRLGSIEPAADFVLFVSQSSGTSGSVTRSPMELFPDDQLEWGMSLNKMVTPSVRTSVCVWCSREFSLEGVEFEPQSESLGYMCPDCKSKISGQLGLLNNGFS